MRLFGLLWTYQALLLACTCNPVTDDTSPTADDGPFCANVHLGDAGVARIRDLGACDAGGCTYTPGTADWWATAGDPGDTGWPAPDDAMTALAACELPVIDRPWWGVDPVDPTTGALLAAPGADPVGPAPLLEVALVHHALVGGTDCPLDAPAPATGRRVGWPGATFEECSLDAAPPVAGDLIAALNPDGTRRWGAVWLPDRGLKPALLAAWSTGILENTPAVLQVALGGYDGAALTDTVTFLVTRVSLRLTHADGPGALAAWWDEFAAALNGGSCVDPADCDTSGCAAVLSDGRVTVAVAGLTLVQLADDGVGGWTPRRLVVDRSNVDTASLVTDAGASIALRALLSQAGPTLAIIDPFGRTRPLQGTWIEVDGAEATDFDTRLCVHDRLTAALQDVTSLLVEP